MLEADMFFSNSLSCLCNWYEYHSRKLCSNFTWLWKLFVSHIRELREFGFWCIFFSCYASELPVVVRTFYLLFVLLNTISVSCKCYWVMVLVTSCFSHPRGTTAARGGAAQTVNDIIIVRAPGLTPSAAPVWTGVRSCGLSTNSLSSAIPWDHSSDQRFLSSRLLPTNVNSTIYVTVNFACCFLRSWNLVSRVEQWDTKFGRRKFQLHCFK
jgi:hypothetical protein